MDQTPTPSNDSIRLMMSFQILLFMYGALAHAGYVPFSYPHFQARVAETVVIADYSCRSSYDWYWRRASNKL
ncbi:hypothetical protein CIK05_01130 [Bdellovibrio sp. qaytius]|nr:hypothetical protein CIK05_01130 [Bdellovibrio sp. qaytius]